MKWPWVSRRAFDLLAEQVVFLKAQLAVERDHSQRIERAQAGLGELAPKPRKPLSPMPDSVKELIAEYDDKDVRRQLTQQAWGAHRAGRPWQEIETRLREALTEVGP